MSTTTNMGITLPTPGITSSPTWAELLNTAITTIDSHDHSSGKGAKVTPSGITINSDLDFTPASTSYSAINLRTAKLTNLPAVLSLTADNSSIFQYSGDLYYRNSSGNNVRITNGSGIDASSIGGIGGDYATSTASVAYSTALTNFSFTQETGIYSKISVGDILLYETIASANAVTIKSPTSLAGAITVTTPSVTGTLATLADTTQTFAGLSTFSKNVTINADIVTTAANRAIFAALGANTLTIGGGTSAVSIPGALGVTGAITGNVTGNCSGTAATVTGAAQTAITSVGTLTGLTVAGNVDTTAGTRSIYASIGANTLTLAGASSTVSVPGTISFAAVDATAAAVIAANAGVTSVTAKTSDYAIQAADVIGGKVFTNEGATAVVKFTLVTAAANNSVSFYVQNGYAIKILANTGDTIRFNDVVTAAAGYTFFGQVGDYIKLTAINATEWVGTTKNITTKKYPAKGYIMGGNIVSVSKTAVIEDLNFSTETSAAISAALVAAINTPCGLSATSKAYCAGGSTGAASAAIDALICAVETISVLDAVLSTARFNFTGSGINSPAKGYCGGGYTNAGVNTIDGFTFIIETCAAITATLTAAAYQIGACSGPLKGYFMGGYTSGVSNAIDGLSYATEVRAAITATIDSARYGGCGVSGTSKGYIIGGTTGSVSAAIDDLNFSTETSVAISATLDAARNGPAGVSGVTKCYAMGGYNGSDRVTTIDDLNLFTETSAAIAATLDTAKYDAAGAQG